VTNFQRPEDGAGDPGNPSDFYVVTTSSFGPLPAAGSSSWHGTTPTGSPPGLRGS